MKTQITSPRNMKWNSVGFVIILTLASVAFVPAHAQTQKISSTEVAQKGRTIKGVVSDSNGPLESASVILKGTKTGTTTDSNGEFTFPTPLKTGDILLISFLGFETQQAQIKENADFLRLTLTEDLIEFVGALNTDKPYKSKRSN